MNLIKAIKLHRKLRIRQEYACFKVCQYSQALCRGTSPFLSELSALNRAVKKIEDKLPEIYFILSDLFGGAYTLRKQSKEYILNKEEENNKWRKNIKPFCLDLIPDPGFPFKNK